MKSWWIPLVMAGCLISGAARAELLSVAVDTANFRDGPSLEHDVLFTAQKYYAVEVIEKKGDWVKARDFEGDVAWIAARLLKKQEAVVVQVPCAIVRQEPDKNSPIAFKVDRSEGMSVHARQGAWLQVTNMDGAKGWVHRDVVWGDEKR